MNIIKHPTIPLPENVLRELGELDQMEAAQQAILRCIRRKRREIAEQYGIRPAGNAAAKILQIVRADCQGRKG